MKLRRLAVLAAAMLAGVGAWLTSADAAPTGDGEEFFEQRVYMELVANGCVSCHIPAPGYVHPSITYRELLPYLAMGRAADNNALTDKLANVRSIRPDRPAHIGGQRCDNLEAEPCKALAEWWEVEFGEDAAQTEVIGIVDVATTTPARIDARPMENTSVWQVAAGDTPLYAERDDFLSADGSFHVGYSQYETMTLEIKDWPWDEFMYLIDGEVEIIDRAGKRKIYGPGDMLVMPQGFSGTWKQLGPLKKISASYGSD
ncbi:MAG TPA: cupin domain-containing protein [Acidobacteriota bacterium]|nr:cupin domain-containing protein [Acidobacteriota bacterium]